MNTVPYARIVEEVARLCVKAASVLPADVRCALDGALAGESSPRGRSFLKQCIENAALAEKQGMPMCQDTGFAVFFVELGAEVFVDGGMLTDAIAQGTARGYTEGYLRTSIVADPLFERKNTGDNTPPVIHISLVPGDTLRITVAPKGAGSENVSALRMLKPSDGEHGVIDFVIGTVVGAGGNPCPPSVVGVGIGGTFETCALLAKKALLREVGQPSPEPRYARIEKQILRRINASGVGPQGLGGTITSLAVHIETFPCHMASLPVAVNVNCHAARHATVDI